MRGEGPWRWWDEEGEVEGEFVGARAPGAGGMREGRLRWRLLLGLRLGVGFGRMVKRI